MSLRRFVKTVSSVSPRATVADAAAEMKRHLVGAVVVVSDDGRPVGLLTDRDIALRVVAEERDPGRTPVEDVMTRSVASVPENATIERATEVMRDCGIRRLPIVDDDNRLVGLVSFDDVVLLLGMELGNLASAIFTGIAARGAGPIDETPTERHRR
jgi:CBS domain-containing protein